MVNNMDPDQTVFSSAEYTCICLQKLSPWKKLHRIIFPYAQGNMCNCFVCFQ